MQHEDLFSSSSGGASSCHKPPRALGAGPVGVARKVDFVKACESTSFISGLLVAI